MKNLCLPVVTAITAPEVQLQNSGDRKRGMFLRNNQGDKNLRTVLVMVKLWASFPLQLSSSSMGWLEREQSATESTQKSRNATDWLDLSKVESYASCEFPKKGCLFARRYAMYQKIFSVQIKDIRVVVFSKQG